MSAAVGVLSSETRNQLATIGLEVRGAADLVWTPQDHDLSIEARYALKLWLERIAEHLELVEAGRYQADTAEAAPGTPAKLATSGRQAAGEPEP
jgi:hypothetical protein